MNKYIIYTDGASRGNPGKAAASFIIKDDRGKVLIEKGFYLGMATNNEAEYQAVIMALSALLEKIAPCEGNKVEIRSDSLLVVNQLSGEFKIKNPRLKVMTDKIKKMESEIGQINYIYIPRTENFRADYL